MQRMTSLLMPPLARLGRSAFLKPSLLSISLIALSGCGGGAPQSLEELPRWVSHTPLLCGVGYAPAGPSTAMSRTAATALGRNDLAAKLSVQLKSILEQYEDEGAALELQSSLSQQAVSAELSGTKQRREHVTQAGERLVLVCVEAREVRAAIERVTSAYVAPLSAPSSPKREAQVRPVPRERLKRAAVSLRAKAGEALNRLDEELTSLDD